MKFLDLFAGIGGFRLGMERAGHECVGFCEIDQFARKSYKAIHDTEGEFEFHDITAVADESVRGIGRVDVICGGFPCQAFSIAGKRAGFEDTRGTLFFDIARFASILRPKYLFLENVTGLLNHDNGNTFETILGALDELGYDAEWQVFNSKNFGVPQNRERVFIIGHLRGASGRAIFPFGGNDTAIDSKQSKINKVGNIRKMGRSQSGDVVSVDSLAPTLCSTTTQKDPLKVAIPVLTPDREEKRQNGRRFKTDSEPMFTLTAQDKHGVLVNDIKVVGTIEPNFNQSGCVYDPEGIAPTIRTMQGGGLEPKIAVREATAEEQGVVTPNFRIRKLTPRECWRLQGFPDWAFDKAQAVNSNSQLYKQAGNSVTVNVIEAIARRLG
ncbi:DNA cytosine methyltransferase [Streptococcus suis]|uniref:Cytosine-specific methyltransferase n=1 Tax=Streptococcus suis R61 TaxID=996306 RepID=A0AA87F8D8_STRSU|nr:DNA cytosine methyltransferase [Streptococcus suis]ANM47459.1 DNA-cytosine methyltransferase [Streptococcus phage phiJH1301-1]ATZ02946.1 DNA (cytosine-5-)-methyltransferase [Streptococcus suis]EHC03007.1 putative DNA methylase [Streptococcus suis R61]MBY4981791.1 DNA cytosine methyltransferase [Streptococcus suis]MBY4992537.1 DNA cytosine methyltransferase [Streptococcus suis]